VRRGGFATRAAAVAVLEALASPATGPEPGLSTGKWLSRWLPSRVSLRASTARSYAAHIRGYLVPYLGGIPLAALSAGDVQAMFTAIIRDESALGRPVGAATLHRIHATLRATLNGAVRAGLVTVNPGRFPELPRAARPRPQVWTPALTERWQREGWLPVVGVWTATQTAQFLRQVRGHRLYALFHLVALRGLRRGEAAGLRWSDLDLDAGTLAVTGQLQQLGGRMVSGPPKSDAGRRVIALDKTTIAALREHWFRQQAERAAAGTRWAGTGCVFTTRAGKPVGPDRMTRLFRRLVAESGLPPVTLHGLRHGAATLALAAGTDLKIGPLALLPTTRRHSCSRQAPGVRAWSSNRREGARRNPGRPGRDTATDRMAEVAPPDRRTGGLPDAANGAARRSRTAEGHW
jgi:integrase